MLEIGNLELLWHGRTVVRIDALHVGCPGLLFVVGASGAGKSSLIHALSGAMLAGGLTVRGEVRFDGRPLHEQAHRVVTISQHRRVDGEDSESRRFEDVRDGLARPADLYLIDEPTFGLDNAQAGLVREGIRRIARQATVLVVTHNRQDCLALGGKTALLAGGEIQEVAVTEAFFAAPQSAAARVYVDTGNCNVLTPPAAMAETDGIWWLVPGLLCGMSRPGLVADAAAQYRQLSERGVRLLLCMEERCTYPIEPLREFGVSRHHFAVPDMAPPSFAQAVDLCRLVESPIRDNTGVAVHCRGGLGRTGTALAAILIWFGDAAETAIRKVRGTQLRAIQTVQQERFLIDFADRIRGWSSPQ